MKSKKQNMEINEPLDAVPKEIAELTATGHHNIELDPRTELGIKLRKILLRTHLKQKEIAQLLDIQQPEVSHLLNGHFNRFTVDKLIYLLERLGWKVKFEIHKINANKSKQ